MTHPLLHRALQLGRLRELDYHFALHIADLCGDAGPALPLAAALVSRHTGDGHVCLDLTEVAGTAPFPDEPLAELLAPPLESWRAALRASPAVGAPGELRPLILDEADRLYLGRYFAFEQSVAERLRALAADRAGVELPRLKAALDRHFPDAPADDRQRLAAAVAGLRRLTVIAGGPGTGKTTTVARILAMAAEEAAPARPRILLAAPTGKAAARLTESLRRHLASLPEGIARLLPTEAMTLHRLLGWRPGESGFRHHAGNPLHLSLLVVDEVSMVDLPLMARLLEALPGGARLILLGDPDQLASVEAGSVLGDLCNRGGEPQAPSPALAARLDALGCAPPAGAPAATPLADSLVVLSQSHRFAGESGIGRLARAVNAGDVEESLRLAGDPDLSDCRWVELTPATLPNLVAVRAIAGFRDYLRCPEPEAALAAFNRFRFLCTLREGPCGVIEVNRLVEQTLRERRLITGSDRHYAGRPLLITRNDYNVRLFNGDVGLVLPDPAADGRLRAFFPEPGGGVRRVLLNRLPEHETVFAMTIHKSQGSEFDRCVVLLPEIETPILTRELLYTGITRARSAVEVWGSGALLAAGVGRRIARRSGLREGVWEPRR